MVNSMHTHTPPSWNNTNSSHTSLVPLNQEDDPVRLARDRWVSRHTNVSDSSEIIDSLDVDMPDANQAENTTQIYVILDTNILIHHLITLKQALARIEANIIHLNVVMLVPGIVVSELDYQKNSARVIAIESRRASDWLAREIGTGRGQVKGQAYKQTMLPSGDWRQRTGLSNDELILDCCRYFGYIKRKDVLLCTSDNNLAVQAYANAENLFVRGASAVIRPPREFWNGGQLLERAVPGFSMSIAASIHASNILNENRGGQSHAILRSSPVPPPSNAHPPASYTIYSLEDDANMEIDMDDHLRISNKSPQAGSPKGCRDILHRQMAGEIGQHLRKLTGKVASLQQQRREHESTYSSANARFTGKLPTQSDWSQTWSLRKCLGFVAKIPPPQGRPWSFGDGEASSLADFLGMPGEKGARPGREWSKNDWERGLIRVQGLAQDFGFEELNAGKMAEYKYAVMEVFAIG